MAHQYLLFGHFKLQSDQLKIGSLIQARAPILLSSRWQKLFDSQFLKQQLCYFSSPNQLM